MKGQYLYATTFTNGGGESSSTGGPGGDPTGDSTIAADDYITGIKFWPFTATWASYLGCGLEIYTKNSNTYSFLGSYNENSAFCGEAQTYTAPTGSMVMRLTESTTGITGIVTSPVCSTDLCAVRTWCALLVH